MGFRDAIDSLQHCVCGKEHRLKLLVEVSEEALERTPALLEAAGMPKRIHVTEKPLQLMRDIVHICVPGGRILDPFAGAGTTILAAVQEGYEAVGVEVTDAYYRLGGDRVRTALADGDVRTAEASNGEQGIQLDAQKR